MTLAELRRSKNLTQMDLAIAVGCHVRLYGRWETGEGAPGLRHAAKLARVLDVSLETIAEMFA